VKNSPRSFAKWFGNRVKCRAPGGGTLYGSYVSSQHGFAVVNVDNLGNLLFSYEDIEKVYVPGQRP
jgi:hypothetical protein